MSLLQRAKDAELQFEYYWKELTHAHQRKGCWDRAAQFVKGICTNKQRICSQKLSTALKFYKQCKEYQQFCRLFSRVTEDEEILKNRYIQNVTCQQLKEASKIIERMKQQLKESIVVCKQVPKLIQSEPSDKQGWRLMLDQQLFQNRFRLTDPIVQDKITKIYEQLIQLSKIQIIALDKIWNEMFRFKLALKSPDYHYLINLIHFLLRVTNNISNRTQEIYQCISLTRSSDLIKWTESKDIQSLENYQKSQTGTFWLCFLYTNLLESLKDEAKLPNNIDETVLLLD